MVGNKLKNIYFADKFTWRTTKYWLIFLRLSSFLSGNTFLMETSSKKTLDQLKIESSLECITQAPVGDSFTLEDHFIVEFQGGKQFRVSLVEKTVLKAFHCFQPLYEMAGKVPCSILDFAWNLGGTETIAEGWVRKSYGTFLCKFIIRNCPRSASVPTASAFS